MSETADEEAESVRMCRLILLNPLPDDKILDWSKLKQIAGDIF